MHVGERIKTRRKQLKISADEIAKKLAVSRSTIFRYENGEIEKLPVGMLKAIADMLETTPSKLMGWETETSEDFIAIFEELEPDRQRLVYNFAAEQLAAQRQMKVLDSSTIAAHLEDDVTELEMQEILGFIENIKKN
ncbi:MULTISPECIES: helix-turn-helix domain-containing protein [Listeria]|uniref:helix-turn-helix domain-containing protein n=1 Tax=Listeria TaxID=1637 RepID=UPI000B58FE97|nr:MULTISPECIES: helix-turn-helix transcriptional regulator [Listeria]